MKPADCFYPPGFFEAEAEYLGITEPPPEIEPRPSFVERKELLPIRVELRAAVNRMNEHIDASKAKGSKSAF